MSCLQVHDFITGTTITVPGGEQALVRAGGNFDIVRPNGGAAALVADHLAQITALAAQRTALRRSSNVAAVAL